MKLVYPEFLYALFALIIPIVVHLFNFRRFKKIKFSNVKFLEEVKLETKSRSRLKHLLVLASRLLALTALVLAFCLPYIPLDDQQTITGRKAVSIYIDNSFSMNGENEKGILLEQAKELARNIAGDYEQSDRFQLLTNDFEGKHQRLVSREEFINYVDEVKLAATVRKVSEVDSRIKEALGGEDIKNNRAFILSDFQSSFCDFESVVPDTNYFFNLVPIQQNKYANIYIDSLWFTVPVRQLNSNEELNVKVVNLSEREVNNLGLKLMINDKQKALSTVSIPPNSSAIASLVFSNEQPGIMKGVVEIDDHPITFDDNFYLSYDVSEKINVLNISQNQGNVRSIFSGDEFFNYTNTKPNNIDYSSFKTQDLIILDGLKDISSGLNQELRKFVESGGSLMLLPSSSINVKSYNEFFVNMDASRISRIKDKEVKVSKINLDSYFYDGVFAQVPGNIDLPKVKKYLDYINLGQSREEVLLSMQNGAPFLSSYPVGNGKFYVFAVGSKDDMSNLSKHAIYVTSIMRAAELSAGRQELYQTIGDDKAIKVNSRLETGEEPFHLTQEKNNFDFIPAFQNYGDGLEIFTKDQIREAENYVLKLEGQNITGIAYNYNRLESNMQFLSVDEIENQVNQSNLTHYKVLGVESEGGTTLNSETEGRKLWKWFVLAALVFLLIEVLFLRLL